MDNGQLFSGSSFRSPPPPFKAFFSRPLVPLLIWAPGPKCLGVKTDSRRGRGGFRSPQPPFPLLLPSASQSCSHPTTSPPPTAPGSPAPQPPGPEHRPRQPPQNPAGAIPGSSWGRGTKQGLAGSFSWSREVAQLSSEAQPQAGNARPNGPQPEGRRPRSDHRPFPGPWWPAAPPNQPNLDACSLHLILPGINT